MSTKVVIEPGICKLTCVVVAESVDDEVNVSVSSDCKAISGLFSELGTTFDPFEVCLQKPGCGPFFDCARDHFSVHGSCPVLNGVIKAIEVEAKLALPHDESIRFE